ncbi:MAG: PUR family DNA/RNA-binding protein [Bacteroidetes bacterium]|nr:PUR family DNA/RNA-binding protein [Bacteroidota bacterium]MBU1720048.1 PUR family DNA/RNA-binding protein [Bacteroidota bacterium]
MEGIDNDNRDRAEIFSRAVRAGKRTYFFDVKSTRSGDQYLTITESKKRFTQDGKFNYEKHKLFLYKEDFDKFSDGLSDVIEFIRTGKAPERQELEISNNDFAVSFDDIESDEEKT